MLAQHSIQTPQKYCYLRLQAQILPLAAYFN